MRRKRELKRPPPLTVSASERFGSPDSPQLAETVDRAQRFRHHFWRMWCCVASAVMPSSRAQHKDGVVRATQMKQKSISSYRFLVVAFFSALRRASATARRAGLLLWLLVCYVGMALAKVCAYVIDRMPSRAFGTRHVSSPTGSRMEDGNADGRSWSGSNGGVPLFWTSRVLHRTASTEDISGGNAVYYDVEEGEFQPSHRLLFRRTASADHSLTAFPTVHVTSEAAGAASPIAPNGKPSRSPAVHAAADVAAFAGTLADDMSAADAAAAGYFSTATRQRIGKGSFVIVSFVGRGTYSSVWLAMDVRGVTAHNMPASMMHRLVDTSGYNGSTGILSGSLQHTFVVLKVSRCRQEYVEACEAEFATNRMLLLELQRQGFSLDRFLLFPASFLEPAVGAPANSPRPNAAGMAAPLSDAKRNVHFVQVSEVCGPSLLYLLTDAPPTRGWGSKPPRVQDRLWRLDAVRRIALEVLEGLSQLHRCRVVHSDLKPENILFTLPSVALLESMQSEEKRQPYMTSAQKTLMHRNFILAKHRAELLCKKGAWRQITQRNRELADSGLDDVDVVQSITSVKIADLGSSLPLPPHCSRPRRSSGSLLSASSSTSNVADDTGSSVCGAGPSQPSSKCSSYGCLPEAVTPSKESPGRHRMHPGAPEESNTQQTMSEHADKGWRPRLLQTREYRSPEVIVQLHPSYMISSALDVWSFGCMLFELVSGHYLFHPRLVRSATHQGHTAEASGDEIELDRIHLDMMRELLCPCGDATIPEMIRTEGLYSSRYFDAQCGVGGPPRSSSAAETPRLQHRREFLYALMVARCTGEDASLRQQLHSAGAQCSATLFSAPCSGGSSRTEKSAAGGVAEFARELLLVADVVALTLEWLPSERPSPTELQRHAWFRQSPK